MAECKQHPKEWTSAESREILLEPSRTDTYGMYPYLEYPQRQSDIVPLSLLGRLGRIEICRVVSLPVTRNREKQDLGFAHVAFPVQIR
jgi:hypothetical protein